jgi:flagellar biosynthesis protein FlhA
MARIINNYELKVLKPVSEETIKMFRKTKQDRNVMEINPFDIMKLYIGLGLIPLVNEELEDNLIKRVRRIRNTIAIETGIIIPSIRIVDDINLESFEFSFFIRDKQIIKYEIKRNKYICIPCGNIKKEIAGKKIRDLVSGVPAILINKNQIKEASDAGYVVADAPCIIMTCLCNLIKDNLHEIFTYDNSKNILSRVSAQNPSLIEDCYSKYTHIEIKKILCKILEKKKTLLNIHKIMESLLLYAEKKDNIEEITDLIVKEI